MRRTASDSADGAFLGLSDLPSRASRQLHSIWGAEGGGRREVPWRVHTDYAARFGCGGGGLAVAVGLFGASQAALVLYDCFLARWSGLPRHEQVRGPRPSLRHRRRCCSTAAAALHWWRMVSRRSDPRRILTHARTCLLTCCLRPHHLLLDGLRRICPPTSAASACSPPSPPRWLVARRRSGRPSRFAPPGKKLLPFDLTLTFTSALQGEKLLPRFRRYPPLYIYIYLPYRQLDA